MDSLKSVVQNGISDMNIAAWTTLNYCMYCSMSFLNSVLQNGLSELYIVQHGLSEFCIAAWTL